MCVSALGYGLLPLCACLVRSWRLLLAVLSLPGLLYIPLWWLIPESPHWLLAKGRAQEADAIVRAAAHRNGITPPNVIFKGPPVLIPEGVSQSSAVSYTYMDLIRTTKTRNITLLNSVIWFIITISYFGLSLSTANMNVDPAGGLRSAGLVLLLTHAVPPAYGAVTIVLAAAAKLGVMAAFSVLYISTVEQFSTVVRGMGMGVCSTCSKIGSTVAPFFLFVSHYDQALPYIFMGVLTVVAGLLGTLMPETRGMPLPEDLSQVASLIWCCNGAACQGKNQETPKTPKRQSPV